MAIGKLPEASQSGIHTQWLRDPKGNESTDFGVLGLYVLAV